MRRQVEEPAPGREAARGGSCARRSGWCHVAWPPTPPVRYALLIAGFLLLTILMTWPRARHAGRAPQVMAAFRNAAIGLIHALGSSAVTATCRLFATQPLAALLALGIRPDLE